MENGGLLFIPDISGFTKFVTETEIEHSRYIIEELLENIINSNQIGLNISEIEGDAVLFYRFGKTPTLEEIYHQVEFMFCNFQKQIKNYEVRRICECSACVGAINLSLKVITHYGQFSTYNVRDFSKLIGKDVIVAHQLLKNDIDFHEYWLVTNELYNTKHEEILLPEWINWQHGRKQVENGEVRFHYSMLTQLKDKVKPDPIAEFGLGADKIKLAGVTKTIDSDSMTVFSTMGDFSLRPKWQEGVKGIDQISHPIYHLGLKYRCILDKGSRSVYVSSFSQENDIISLSETDEKKTGALYVTLKSTAENKTMVTFDYYIKKNLFSKIIATLFVKNKLEKSLQKSLDNLESIINERKEIL